MSLVVASGLHGLGPGILVGAEIDLALEIVEWSGHIRLMGHPQRDYHYRLRKYARRRGVIWRWFIFEGESGPVETGIVLEPDRDKAEAAAKEAMSASDECRQEPIRPKWSPEQLATTTPRTTRPS